MTPKYINDMEKTNNLLVAHDNDNDFYNDEKYEQENKDVLSQINLHIKEINSTLKNMEEENIRLRSIECKTIMLNAKIDILNEENAKLKNFANDLMKFSVYDTPCDKCVWYHECAKYTECIAPKHFKERAKKLGICF